MISWNLDKGDREENLFFFKVAAQFNRRATGARDRNEISAERKNVNVAGAGKPTKPISHQFHSITNRGKINFTVVQRSISILKKIFCFESLWNVWTLHERTDFWSISRKGRTVSF